MSDASNKPDLKDSRRAYGFVIMFMGGPIIAQARKLNHCSSATAANEYMALGMTTRSVIWLRQLFKEIGLDDCVKEPTIIYADNSTANQWCNEEQVTQGNQWILQEYHYVREMGPTGEKMIKVTFTPTKYNLADLFTKGVLGPTIDFLRPYLLGQSPLADLLKSIRDAGGQSYIRPESNPKGEGLKAGNDQSSNKDQSPEGPTPVDRKVSGKRPRED